MMHGLEVTQTFVETGVSGSVRLGNRLQDTALLGILKPGEVMITAKLDRMFRSALDALDVLAKLKAAGVSLHMIDLSGDMTGSSISELVLTILSAVTEAEHDRRDQARPEDAQPLSGSQATAQLSRRRRRRAGRRWGAAASASRSGHSGPRTQGSACATLPASWSPTASRSATSA